MTPKPAPAQGCGRTRVAAPFGNTAEALSKNRLNVQTSYAAKRLGNYKFKEDALSLKKSKLWWAPKTVVVSSIALAIGLADLHSSIAGCGGYCEARRVRAICHQAISIQGLKGHERDVEFEKCKANPLDYLQIGEFADDLENGLEQEP